MAQKYYEVKLVSITTLGAPSYKIDKVKVNVKNSGKSVVELVKSDFVLSSAAAIPADDWDLINIDKANGDYEVSFKQDKELANNSYLIVKVKRDLNDSDRLFIDFAETFDKSGQATYSYKVDESGSYSFIIDKAAGETLETKSPIYIFNKAPNTENSSIVAQFAKPYLAQIIPADGLDVSLRVTLKDSAGKAVIGANEVSLYADLQ